MLASSMKGSMARSCGVICEVVMTASNLYSPEASRKSRAPFQNRQPRRLNASLLAQVIDVCHASTSERCRWSRSVPFLELPVAVTLL